MSSLTRFRADPVPGPGSAPVARIARELGVTPRRINEIVNEKRSITADTAIRLSLYFGNSAQFWLGLQMDYDLDLAQDKLLHKLKSEVNTTQAMAM